MTDNYSSVVTLPAREICRGDMIVINSIEYPVIDIFRNNMLRFVVLIGIGEEKHTALVEYKDPTERVKVRVRQ